MYKVKNRKDGELKQNMKPSKFCIVHKDKAAWARGLCRNCYDKWLKENNPEYAKKQKNNCSEWHKKNKERHKKYKEKWVVKQDPQYGRIRSLRRYGMTLDDYDVLLKQQKGVCAICGNSPKKGKNLHIDHDHNTGVIRGLLCFRCNFGLSYFGENVDTLEKAFKYLKSSNKKGCKLMKVIDDRVKLNGEEREKLMAQINTSKTKYMRDKDIIKIQKLKESGKKLKELCEKFPQYSRSSIYRASKKK